MNNQAKLNWLSNPITQEVIRDLHSRINDLAVDLSDGNTFGDHFEQLTAKEIGKIRGIKDAIDCIEHLEDEE